MNRITFTLLIFTIAIIISDNALSQGKNISLARKMDGPYITTSKDTLVSGTQVIIALGSNSDGSFKYIQLLNGAMNRYLQQRAGLQ